MKLSKFIAGITATVVISSLTLGAALVSAAGITGATDTMDRQKVSEAADHTITFTTPTGVASAETITVTFPVGFDLATNSVAFSDMDLSGSVEGDQTLAAVAASATWGAAVSGQVVTFTSATGTFAPTETITIKIGTVATGGANKIINPATASSTATSYTVSVGGTMADSGSFVVPIQSDDQVQVSGIVLSELTFEFVANDDAVDFFSASANAVDLGNLSSSSSQFATEGAGTGGAAAAVAGGAHGFKAGTNAAAGYSVSVSGTTLTSGSNTVTAIGSTAASSGVGTEQFGLCVTDDATGVSGTTKTDDAQQGVITAAYDCGGTGFAFDDTATNLIATGNASGATSMTFYDVQYLANITALTEAGTYTTDLTWTAVATF